MARKAIYKYSFLEASPNVKFPNLELIIFPFISPI